MYNLGSTKFSTEVHFMLLVIVPAVAPIIRVEITHLLMEVSLCSWPPVDWFGFSSFATLTVLKDLLVSLNPNK